MEEENQTLEAQTLEAATAETMPAIPSPTPEAAGVPAPEPRAPAAPISALLSEVVQASLTFILTEAGELLFHQVGAPMHLEKMHDKVRAALTYPNGGR